MNYTKYHGWVLVKNQDGLSPQIVVEWTDEHYLRHQLNVDSATAAFEFWDARVGQPVYLLPTSFGYRVYTQEVL